jgi:hypothetical protein
MHENIKRFGKKRNKTPHRVTRLTYRVYLYLTAKRACHDAASDAHVSRVCQKLENVILIFFFLQYFVGTREYHHLQVIYNPSRSFFNVEILLFSIILVKKLTRR